MHKVSYRFEDFEALRRALDAEDTDLALPDQSVKDGQWLLATFQVGDESTSVAARVIDRGDSLRLVFEERDQLRLRHFANGNGRTSERLLAVAEAPQGLLPGSSALVVSGSAPIANIVGQLIQGWGRQRADREQRGRRARFSTPKPGGRDRARLTLARARLQRPVRSPVALASGTRPSVLLLGHDPTCADAHAALAAGADDFVQKPFRAQELRARLVGLLEHKLCG